MQYAAARAARRGNKQAARKGRDVVEKVNSQNEALVDAVLYSSAKDAQDSPLARIRQSDDVRQRLYRGSRPRDPIIFGPQPRFEIRPQARLALLHMKEQGVIYGVRLSLHVAANPAR